MSSSDPASFSLASVQRAPSLRETVLEQLRAAIVTGELAEGTLVSAPSVGAQLGVSATPVREAMMDLVREGLVEIVKNKGFRITTMSDQDLDNLAEIRMMLEPPAMHIVVRNIQERDFAPLERLANECLAAAESEDLAEYLHKDRDFHAGILAHTHNRQLVDLATSLRRQTRLYGIAKLAHLGQLSSSGIEHLELLRQLREGNGAGAEQLLREHIGRTRGSWATGTPETAGASNQPDAAAR